MNELIIGKRLFQLLAIMITAHLVSWTWFNGDYSAMVHYLIGLLFWWS